MRGYNMKNKNKIIVAVIAGLILIAAAIFLIIKLPNKNKSQIKAVAYITYYDQFNADFQTNLQKTVEGQEKDFLLFNSNKSSASAESNLTSAINSKVNTVFIDFPNEEVTLKLAKKAKDSGVAPVILNYKSKDFASYTLNTDKAKKDMISNIEKSLNKDKDLDLVVGLYAKDNTKANKELVANTVNDISTKNNVNKEYVVNSEIIDQDIVAKEYLIDLLFTTNDRENILLVCDTARLAAGLQQAVTEMGLQSKVTIACFDNSPAMEQSDVRTLSLKRDYTATKDLINKPKTKDISYEIKKINL